MDKLRTDIETEMHQMAARSAGPTKGLMVRSGQRQFPLIDYSSTGFSVAAEDTPPLSGFVDIERAGECQSRCLIVLAREDDGVLHYEFKRRTDAQRRPPVDYVISENAPVGLLT
ncbi:MAG: hypothetical protein AAF367_09705 [Pseudomonadota bacterium]